MKNVRYFFYLSCALLSGNSLSQSIPSDLADLSLQELMRLDIREKGIESASNGQPWSLGYAYRKSELRGYGTGTSDLADEEVLFRPESGEMRTGSNYPVLPTTITQKAHIINLGYQLSPGTQLNLSVPYIMQGTDHISSKAMFEEFRIESSGIGDVVLSLTYQWRQEAKGKWQVTSSLSIPTGSIDKRGDTPKNGFGTQDQLPYTMQLGSGTFDFPVALNYNNSQADLNYGAQLSAKIRTGTNDRGYRLGNHYNFNLWGRYTESARIQPGININFKHTGRIKGRDEDLIMEGLFPFPASITNPDNYGGSKVDLAASLRFCLGNVSCNRYMDLEYKKPVYLDLNGIQVQENVSLALNFVARF